MNETIKDKLKFCFNQQKLLQIKFKGKQKNDLSIKNSTFATTLYREEPSSEDNSKQSDYLHFPHPRTQE